MQLESVRTGPLNFLPRSHLVLDYWLTDHEYQDFELGGCFAFAFLQEMSSEDGQERRDLVDQRVREEYLRNAFHMDLEQLRSSRPRELLGYALHWSALAVHEAEEWVRECGDSEKANQRVLPDRPSLEEQNQDDMFLFQRPKGPGHADHVLLYSCYRTRSAILSLCGRNLDALEAARLGLDSATRLEDHEYVASFKRLISDVEQDIVEEEEEQEDDDDVDGEPEGGD